MSAHGDEAPSEPADETGEHAAHDTDPRLAAGLEHLQRAAHEVIAASRALLDVAEELVDDPQAAGTLSELFGSISAFAARMARPTGPTRPVDVTGHDADDDDPPVQRIPVS
jgi:hypothetical protein